VLETAIRGNRTIALAHRVHKGKLIANKRQLISSFQRKLISELGLE
jgi:hypothetical protein